MGLFDIFRSKKNKEQDVSKELSSNQALMAALAKEISRQGYSVALSTEYVALTINDQLEIATEVIESTDYHPNLMHAVFMASHKMYFPEGIIESLVGVGDNITDKIATAIENYLTILSVIMDGFSESHDPLFDFTDSQGIQWHPKVGSLSIQGKWDTSTDFNPLFNLVKEALKTSLADKKFNWIKMYAARQPDGSIMGECRLNNELWQEGTDLILTFAKSWGQPGIFLGQKQFVMVRRCDAHDK